MKYNVTLTEDGNDMTFLVSGINPYTGEDEDTRIHGFPAVFMLCSRWAHTIPGNALNAALVIQKLELARHASLRDLEVVLSQNAQKNRVWLCPEFVESTAADFFLVSRLQHVRSEEGMIFKGFPLLAKYVERDPSLQTPEESDEEEEISRVQMYCTVS
jgi:hypothetical protein